MKELDHDASEYITEEEMAKSRRITVKSLRQRCYKGVFKPKPKYKRPLRWSPVEVREWDEDERKRG